MRFPIAIPIGQSVALGEESIYDGLAPCIRAKPLMGGGKQLSKYLDMLLDVTLCKAYAVTTPSVVIVHNIHSGGFNFLFD